VILAVFAAAVGVAAFNQGGGEEIIPWRTSLDDARDEASADGKLVLAYFTADWCQPCQVMKRTTWANPDVEQKLRQGFVPVKIDIDDQPRLAAGYGVQSVPTYAVLTTDGRPVRAAVGVMPPDEFLNWLADGE